MKKGKFTGLILSFCLLCMGILTGCSLVETDYDRYYNQVVAVVESKKDSSKRAEITKMDLISGYQSYGYTYEQYYGYSRNEAIRATLDLLENRLVTIMTAEEKFGVNSDGTGLSDKEKTYLWEQVGSSLSTNLDSYYEDITGTSSEDEESDEITFEGYDKTAQLIKNDDGSYTIKSLNETEEPLANYHPKRNRDFNDVEDRALIFENFRDDVLNSNENYQKAYSNYLNDLLASEYGQNLSTNAVEVFEREIERLYEVAYQNYLLEKYSYSNRGENTSSISASQIVNLYTNKVRASYAQYALENDSNYDSDVQDSLNEVYYFKNDNDSTKFFTVANVLFMFDDEQKEEYDSLTALREESIASEENNKDPEYTAIEYNQDMDRLYGSIKPVVRVYNELTGIYEEVELASDDDTTVNDIYNLMARELETAQLSGDVNIIGDQINEYIYEYNEDTGMFNAENNYVIGIDSEGNAVSSFVDSFEEAAVELYNSGKGQVGDISGLVRSEYGIHVLIYTGVCENLYDGITPSFTLSEEAIEKLYTTRVNILVDRTYFDVLYDELYADNFTQFEDANVQYLKDTYFTVTEYSGRFRDLLE